MFRFTIRDVLWLTVVVGLGAGWFVNVRIERQRYEELRRAFNNALNESNFLKHGGRAGGAASKL